MPGPDNSPEPRRDDRRRAKTGVEGPGPDLQHAADRLIAAADRVLLAQRLFASADLDRPLCAHDLPELMGTPDEPACLWDFTRREVENAVQFLDRLGLLEPAQS